VNRLSLTTRVRSLTRDLSKSIFRTSDIYDYMNEGVDRLRSYIPELSGMVYFTIDASTPTPLPDSWHHLVAIYATARCFAQDEQHHQASTYMNEFEVKMSELKLMIQNGDVEIVVDDAAVVPRYSDDYVRNVYFNDNNFDDDDGVEGV
jgi:hypothetical protein